MKHVPVGVTQQIVLAVAIENNLKAHAELALVYERIAESSDVVIFATCVSIVCFRHEDRLSTDRCVVFGSKGDDHIVIAEYLLKLSGVDSDRDPAGSGHNVVICISRQEIHQFVALSQPLSTICVGHHGRPASWILMLMCDRKYLKGLSICHSVYQVLLKSKKRQSRPGLILSRVYNCTKTVLIRHNF